MPAAQIAILIAQYGIPFVEYLIGLIQNKTEVTAAEWANLKALASVSGKDELLSRLQANGIDPASPQGLALLALVSAPPPVAASPIEQLKPVAESPLPVNPPHS